MPRKPWTEDQKKKHSDAVKAAWEKGNYQARNEWLSKERLNNPVWRENQKKATSKKLTENNPMSNPIHRETMRRAKQAQFSGYELPSWYSKAGASPIYNKRVLAIFERLSKDLGVSFSFFGENEKKFGRYWVDFYSPELGLVIDWNEKHHEKPEKIIKDELRFNILQENNPDIIFVTLKESDFLTDGYQGEKTYSKIFSYIKECVV